MPPFPPMLVQKTSFFHYHITKEFSQNPNPHSSYHYTNQHPLLPLAWTQPLKTNPCSSIDDDKIIPTSPSFYLISILTQTLSINLYGTLHFYLVFYSCFYPCYQPSLYLSWQSLPPPEAPTTPQPPQHFCNSEKNWAKGHLHLPYCDIKPIGYRMTFPFPFSFIETETENLVYQWCRD